MFNRTLVSTTANQTCKYHNTGTAALYTCNADLEFGPQWSKANLTKCLPKSPKTQQLILLSDVSQNFQKFSYQPVQI